MNTTVEKTLRCATRNLTGNRETDIVYLRDQIEAYRSDQVVRTALERILRCLTVPSASVAAA